MKYTLILLTHFITLLAVQNILAQNKEFPKTNWQEIIRNSKADTIGIKALHTLALQTKDSVIANAYIYKAISLASQINNDYLLGRSYSVLSIKLQQAGYTREGMPALFKARTLFSKLTDKKNLLSCMGNIVRAYENMQMNDSAFILATETLELAKQYKLQEDEARMNLVIAKMITIAIKNDSATLRKARPYYNDALYLYTKEFNETGSSDAVVGIISVKLSLTADKINNREFAGAKQLMITCLPWLSKLNAEEMALNPVTISVYGNMAIIAQYTGQQDSAIYYYKKSLQLAAKNGDVARASNILNNLGQLYVSINNIPNAINFLDSSLTLSMRCNDLLVIRRNHLILYQLYDSMGNTAKAIFHAKEYIRYNDSLYSTEKTNALNELTTKYETDKKDVLNKQLLQENGFRKKIIISLCALAVTLLAGLVFFYRTRVLQRKLFLQEQQQIKAEQLLRDEAAMQKQIALEKENEGLQLNKLLDEEENRQLKEISDFQNRQLTGNALSMEQQNNLLQETYNRLYDIGQKLGDEDKSMAKILRQDIKGSLQLNNDWDKVTLHFDKVHPEFFEKLKTLKSDLTQNDLKLAAYTKLHLSTKDISALLSIDTQSVRVNRYRLKKKLQLPEEQDLSNFILSL